MLFNSYVFFVFLPVVWALYFILNRYKLFGPAQAILVAGSFVFYGYQDPRLCLLLAFSIAVNYLLHLGLTKEKGILWQRRFLLAAGLLVNIGLLFYFKYLNFTLSNLNRFFSTDFTLREIALPLGISFYTFQQISFVIDSYSGKTGRCRLLDYSLFVSFFPQLVAGPIVLHSEMIPQFQDPEKKKINYENLLSGAEYFIMGFAKKVLIADSFARVCDAGYANLSQLNSLSAVLTILAFTLQIYFDFSGYCDMALGLGRFFNLMIPVNFSSPYKAVNISEFWRKWHMTLTRFLTTYLYIPLGGSRKGLWRTCVNIMIVFTVSGLWHGAAWTFVLWGMLHGAAMVFHRVCGKWLDRLPKALLWLGTFFFVNVAWIFFRAEFFRQPWQLLSQVITGGVGPICADMVTAICDKTLWMLTLKRFLPEQVLSALCQSAVVLAFGIGLFVCLKLPSSHELVAEKRRGNGWFVFLSLLFAWSFLQLSQVSKFIYFNF